MKIGQKNESTCSLDTWRHNPNKLLCPPISHTAGCSLKATHLLPPSSHSGLNIQAPGPPSGASFSALTALSLAMRWQQWQLSHQHESEISASRCWTKGSSRDEESTKNMWKNKLLKNNVKRNTKKHRKQTKGGREKVNRKKARQQPVCLNTFGRRRSRSTYLPIHLGLGFD